MPIFDDKIALVDVFVDTSLRLLEITYWHWNYVLSPFGILQQCRYLWIIKIFLIFLSSKKVCHLWKKKLCIVFFHYPVLRPLFIAIVSVYLQILALLSSFAFLSVFYLFNFFFSHNFFFIGTVSHKQFLETAKTRTRYKCHANQEIYSKLKQSRSFFHSFQNTDKNEIAFAILFCHHFHKIVRLFDVLTNFIFTTS